MRKLLAISAFALFFLACPILQSANPNASYISKMKDWCDIDNCQPLEMKDLSNKPPARSGIQNQVFLGEDVVIIVFKKSNVVTVKITNEYNQIMYSKAILPSSTPKLYLSTTSYPSGNYTIELIDRAAGSTLTGYFNIMR